MNANPALHARIWWTLAYVAKAHKRQPPAGGLKEATDRIAALGVGDKAILDAMETELKRWPKVGNKAPI